MDILDSLKKNIGNLDAETISKEVEKHKDDIQKGIDIIKKKTGVSSEQKEESDE